LAITYICIYKGGNGRRPPLTGLPTLFFLLSEITSKSIKDNFSV